MFFLFIGPPLDDDGDVIDLTEGSEHARHVDRFLLGLECCPHPECGSHYPFSCN